MGIIPNPFARRTANAVIERKQQQRQEAFDNLPVELRDPDATLPYEKEIINNVLHNWSTEELRSHLQNGSIKATTVTEIYIKQAINAHLATNCIAEVMFEAALKRAKTLDDILEKTGKPVGPLHGISFSVKDTFDVVGHDSSLGYTSQCFSPKTENSLLVDVLIKSGGILLCKTVVAQALLSFECDNPTFGRVTNPYSDLHTPGGSSGGEGALIAKRGAQFGFASDLAGSLRYPAAFCGNYAIKPSSGRLSLENHYVPVTGQEAIHVVAGPICRSVNDVELLMDIVVSAELHKEDPRTLPIPWRKINTPEKLRIGYYFDDGFIRSSPACQRAVLETVESLKLAGHDVVQIQLPDILDAMRIGFNLFAIENMSQVFSEMGSDPKAFSMWMMELAMFLPKPIKKLVGKLSSALGDEKSAVFIESAYHHSVVESWEWQDRRDQYEKKFLKFWNDNCDSNGKELDAIICPVHGMPPVPHDTLPWLSSCMSYSFLYNVLDYPAGIIPVTTLDPELDAYDSFVENSYLEKRNLEIENTVIHKLMASHYDPVSMKGLPIAVQVVGKKLEDEKTVQVMKVVDECLKAYKNKAFN